MDINWIQAVLYGIISGLSEFVPVSSQAHQLILRSLFGIHDVDHLMNLFAHLGMLTALGVTTGSYIKRSLHEHSFSKTSRRRRKRQVNPQAVCDVNFISTACIPMLLSFLLYSKTQQWENKVPIVSIFLLVNGIILLIPMYLAKGNKDSRHMSSFDAVLFGVASALSAFPGISRIGIGSSFAIARGADPNYAYKWSLFLSAPVLFVLICFDLASLFAVGLAGAGAVYILKCILCGVFSHIGASLAITLLKAITLRNGISGLSYYSFGAALFAFILYLY